MVMDSQNEKRDGVEDDEIYHAAVTVSAEDAGDGRKRSSKIRRKITGATGIRNFSFRSRMLRATAGETDHTSGIHVLGTTPAYTYISRVGRFWKVEIF